MIPVPMRNRQSPRRFAQQDYLTLGNTTGRGRCRQLYKVCGPFVSGRPSIGNCVT